MSEVISNNIMLIQSSVGSLIVFLILSLFRVYFKKKYLHYFSLAWGFLLLSNVFYLSYIINQVGLFALSYVILVLLSAFYYYKAVVYFDEGFFLSKEYTYFIILFFVLIASLILPIDNYYKILILTIISCIYYFRSAIILIKLKKREYLIFGLILIFLVIVSMINAFYQKQDEIYVFISTIQGVLGLMSGIGILWIFSVKQQEIEENNKAELYRLSYLDTLTNCYNRTYLDHVVLNKSEKIYGVVMVDLNNLKEFNDDYGHDTGDLALKMVAKVLLQIIGNQGFVVRRGGDEFIVFVSNSKENLTEELASNIKNHIKMISILEEVVSAAVGYSTNFEQKDILSQMRDAELKMYEDKKNRRKEKEQTLS